MKSKLVKPAGSHNLHSHLTPGQHAVAIGKSHVSHTTGIIIINYRIAGKFRGQ